MKAIEKETFYHRLRMIFCYYASQGSKQNPLMLRQKNFHKFLLQSTISQLVKNQTKNLNLNQKSFTSNQNFSVSKSSLKNIDFNVIVNTITKPLNYEEFSKIITQLIFSLRHQKSWQQVFEDTTIQKDLFEMCQHDKIVSQIFSFLYQEIQQNTQFGQVVIFSSGLMFYNEKSFTLLKKVSNTLKIIYSHYFEKGLGRKYNNMKDVLLILKKFVHEFQITPFHLSFTQIFLLTFELVSKKSKCVCQQILDNKVEVQNKKVSEFQQWSQFTFINWNKLIVLIAFLIQSKKDRQTELSYQNQILLNFLEKMAASKGYKQLSSIYKIKQTLFLKDRAQKKQQQTHFKNKLNIQNTSFSQKIKSKRQIQKSQQSLKFESSKLNDSRSTLILGSIQNVLSLIFQKYSSEDKDQNKMSQKNFQRFCSQFKIVPNLISKRQMGEVYLRIFTQRDYFYQHQGKKYYQEDKLKIFQSISKPELGLAYNQFLKLLTYVSQINKICTKFNSVQRLIYWIQYIYHQSHTKHLIALQSQKNRENTFKIENFRIDCITKKVQANISQNSFYKQYQGMLKKLKNSLK